MNQLMATEEEAFASRLYHKILDKMLAGGCNRLRLS